jgi:hypothetical protein
MSRATRPRRSLRLARSLAVIAFFPPGCAPLDEMLDLSSPWFRRRMRSYARRWGTRPSVLRRCILGRPVSARAASRLLAIVGGGV